MKPSYKPIMFVKMKEAKKDCPWCEGKGYEWVECGELSGYDYREPCRCILRRPPYRPGEKCYVAERWCLEYDDNGYPTDKVLYQSDGQEIIKVDDDGAWAFNKDGTESSPWLSPATMPTRHARRFVTVLSCEPMQRDGVWWWEVRTEDTP